MESKDLFIPTYSGGRVSIGDPLPEQIKIVDVAHSLSQLCRYTGHTKVHYSVAEHCCRLYSLVYNSLGEHINAREARNALAWALLHDGPEFVTGDINRPILWLRPVVHAALTDIQDRIMKVMQSKWDFDGPMPKVVKFYDDQIVYAEHKHLFPTGSALANCQDEKLLVVDALTKESPHHRNWGWDAVFAHRRFMEIAESLGITDEPELFGDLSE